jgi:RNA polymerase sigma factor (sigma-70 family)
MASGGHQAAEVDPPERGGRDDRERGEALVLELLGSHADSLLRVARRYSICADDAHDAYQRALEILMRHAARLDPERAAGWLHTVVKHEALALNRSRRRMVGVAEVDLDALESRTSDSPEERVLAADRVARSAEALHGLKPQEVRALWLKALGHSYEQICEVTGWTYTKDYVRNNWRQGRSDPAESRREFSACADECNSSQAATSSATMLAPARRDKAGAASRLPWRVVGRARRLWVQDGGSTAARRVINSSRGGPGGDDGRGASSPRIVSIRSCSASSWSKTVVRSSRPMRRMVRRRTRSS